MHIAVLQPASRNTPWIEAYKLFDDETGEPVDLSDASEIAVEIFDPVDSTAKLTALLSESAVEHIETGVFQWTFTQAQMQTLDAKSYDINITITKDDVPVSLLIGSLPVVDRYSSSIFR